MMKSIKALVVPLVVVALLVASGCVGKGEAPINSGAPLAVPWKPEGVISPGEYSYTFTSGAGAFSAFFRVENSTLFVGINAMTRGWLAVGFGGGPGMKKSDIVIAYVLPNGTVRISDEYSTGFAGPHNPDTVYGGSEDIISYGGGEDGDFTVVEFSRRLDTGDRYDFKIPANGSFRVIWAYGRTDDFLSDHVKEGQTYISFGGG